MWKKRAPRSVRIGITALTATSRGGPAGRISRGTPRAEDITGGSPGAEDITGGPPGGVAAVEEVVAQQAGRAGQQAGVLQRGGGRPHQPHAAALPRLPE